jgi:hypothetical protein
MNSAAWQVIVTDMQQRGATGTATEMQTVTDYLGKYLARK